MPTPAHVQLTDRPHLVARPLAGLVLGLLLAGVPTLLVTYIGDPFPNRLPTLDDLRAPASTDTVIVALAAAVWLYWAQFAICVIAEIHTAASQRPRTVRIPLAGPSRVLAHRLVGVLLAVPATIGTLTVDAGGGLAALAGTTPIAAAPPLSPVASDDATAPTRSEPATGVRQREAAVDCRLWTVTRTDTLWEIAQTCLGDGRRYVELYELNKGVTQPDGRQLSKPGLIYPGWVIAIPADVAGPTPASLTRLDDAVYTVVPGDTLWDIAARHLPSQPSNAEVAAAWPSLYAANRDLIGDNPDLIHPGQRLNPPQQLPTTDTTPAGPTEDTRSEGPPPTSTPPTPALTTPPGVADTTASATPSSRPTLAQEPSTASPRPGASDRPGATPHASASAVAVPTTAAAPTADAVADDEDEQPARLWHLTGFGALVAGAIVAALSFKRLVQQRRRRPGQRIRMPSRQATDMELNARAAVDPASTDLLDRALRTLAHNAGHAGQPLPGLRLVRADDTGIHLHLTDPAEPTPPFAPTSDPTVWHCHPDAELLTPDQCADQPAPYPALVTIGHDQHGGRILLDLEHVRELTLTGPPTDTVPVLRALAVELSAARLADELAVSCVGFGRELAQTRLAERPRLAVFDSLGDALDDLAAWIRVETETLSAHGLANPRQARSRGLALDLWTPHILLSATPPDADQAERLTAILAGSPATTAVAVTTKPVTTDAWMLSAAPGLVPLHTTGHTLTVQRLDDPTYAQLIAHLEIAEQPATADADWWPHQQDTAAASVTPARAVGTDQPSTTSADGRSERDGPDAPIPALSSGEHSPPGDNEAAAATTPQSAPAQLLRDQDQPVQPDSGHPRVLVLGPVQVTGAKGYFEPGKRGRLTEIAAFLALCPSDDHHALTAAMWPAGCTVNNRNSYMSRVRRWLGADYVPVVAEDGYRLDPRVRCDYHQAKHLIRRGLRLGGPDGDQDLAAALDLVRGVPFSIPAGSKSRYAWADPLRQEAIAFIVDAAAVLADHRLTASDRMGAVHATRAGLRAAPGAEQLWRAQFRALHAAGDHQALDAAIAALDAYNETHGLDFEPDTSQLLEQLLHDQHAAV